MTTRQMYDNWFNYLLNEVNWRGIVRWYNRSRARWARKRNEVEQEIADRQVVVSRSNNAVLHDWE
jgi:hypothetical protein